MATFANTQSNYDLAAAAFAAFNSTAFNTLTTQTRPPHRHAAPNQRADRVSKSTSTTRFPPQPNRHQHRAQHLPTPGPDHPSNTSAASPILPCATFGSPLRRSTGARINSQPHSQIPKKRPLASDMARTSKKPHIGPTSLWPDTTSSSPLRSIPPRPSPPPGMSNHTLPTSPTTAPIGTLFPLASAGTNHTSPPRVAATCPTSNGGDSAVNVDKPVGRPVAKAVEQVRATQEEHRRLSVPRDSGVRDVWSTEEEDNDDDWADFNAKEESSDNGEQVVEPTDSEPTEEIGGDLSVGHGGTPTGKESETIVASIEHADTSAEGDRDVGGAQSDGVMDEQDGGEATATHQKTDSGEAQSGASDIAEKQNREVRADQEESEQADTNTHSNAEPGVQRKPETQKEPEAQKLPEVHVDPGKPSTRPQEEHGEERAAHGQPEESSTQHQDINTEGGLEAAVEAAAVAAVAADNHTASEHRDSRPSGKRKRKAPPAKPAERLVLAEELDSNNESADSEQYVVSHISDHRMFKGISEVYVHWVGYKGQETWERESAIQETAATTLFTYWGSVGGRAAHPPYCGKPNDWGIVYAIRGHYWELCETVVPGRETAEGADNEEEDTDGHFEGDGNDKSEHAGAGKRKAGATTKKAKKRQTKSKTRKVASQTLCLWVEWLGWPKPTVVIEGALRKTHPELVKLYWDRVPGGRPLSPPKTGKV